MVWTAARARYCSRQAITTSTHATWPTGWWLITCRSVCNCSCINTFGTTSQDAEMTEQPIDQKRAVILLSGGLDSATVVAMAQAEGYTCYTMSFDYGQRHRAELNAAARIARDMGVAEHKVIGLNLNGIGGSALTDSSIDVPEAPSEGIPITYVPARNTVFLSLALGWAEVIGAERIVIGVNALDYSGYPDCRPDYIAAFEYLASLATRSGVEGRPLRIFAPLLPLTKAGIIR